MQMLLFCAFIIVCLSIAFFFRSAPTQGSFTELKLTTEALSDAQTALLNRIEALENKNTLSAETQEQVLSNTTDQSENTATGTVVLTSNASALTLPEEETTPLPQSVTTVIDASEVDLENDVTGVLPISMGGTGKTSFSKYGILYGNNTAGLESLTPGNEGYILSSQGVDKSPIWIPLPETDSVFESLQVGDDAAFTVQTDGKIMHTFAGEESAFSIAGNNIDDGTLHLTHSRRAGTNDASASALAIRLEGTGTSANGITVNAASGTSGKLLTLQNQAEEVFGADVNGNVAFAGNLTQGSYGTDTNFTKFGNTVGDQFFLGTNGAFRVQRAGSNSEAFRVQINGDTQGRWRGTSDGSLQWGDGTNAQDVTLRRGSAGTLLLTGGMTLNNANNSYNTVIKGTADSNLFFVNAALNNIGIGTSTPRAPLHIHKNALGSSAFIINQLGTGPLLSASSSGASVFRVDNTGGIRTVASICVKAGMNTNCSGSTAGTVYASNTTVQAADVAENYISEQPLEPGDIVIPAGDGNDQAVAKSTTPYQSQAIGIVSTNPGITLNSDARIDEKHPHLHPIALQGRVYLKVTAKNGTIAPGDLLTPSDIPGVAMKATKSGTIVAKALDAYANDEAVGKIMAFVSISYHGFGDRTVAEAPQPKKGTVTLAAGKTEVDVRAASSENDAHLFVEPEDVPIATATKKTSDDTFTIRTLSPQESDVTLHWWLVE